MTVSLTVEALLLRGRKDLRSAPGEPDPDPTAGRDADGLLAHVLGVSRTRLKSHSESAVDPEHARQYLQLLSRRARGEPLAYLTGRQGFWSLELAVTPAVLIPRPETELLVERALALGPAGEALIADLGTGSGAIALALASERPRWRIVATDLSAPALAVARTNAAALGLSAVEFRQGDWFGPLAGMRFDLLLSNPPYVAAGDPALAAPALGYEPPLALTPGADAMASLRALARGAAPHLTPGGWLLLEHGATQAAEVTRELVLAGFAHVRSHRDLADHERMTEGQR